MPSAPRFRDVLLFVAPVALSAAIGFGAVAGGDLLWRGRPQPALIGRGAAPSPAVPLAMAFAPLPPAPPRLAAYAAPSEVRTRLSHHRRGWRHARSRWRVRRDRTAEYAADAAVTKRLNLAAKARFDARDGR